MRIGVLALQGAFKEHLVVLERLGVNTRLVRLPEDLRGLDGLIIPGGESTTIGKLATSFGLMEGLRSLSLSKAVWGTCAGLVFLAREVGHEQPLLGVMDIVVERNAFGRQVDSFETDLDFRGIPGGPFHGVFIRAPVIRHVGPKVEVLCRLTDGRIVAARQERMLVTAFHPELTSDDRIHQFFLSLAQKGITKQRTK